jgi:hypothetical protein
VLESLVELCLTLVRLHHKDGKIEMNINELTLENLRARVSDLQREWSSKKPFRYVIIDDFLPVDFAEQLLATYPEPDIEGWNDTAYLHQRKKFTKTSGFSEPIERFSCSPPRPISATRLAP